MGNSRGIRSGVEVEERLFVVAKRQVACPSCALIYPVKGYLWLKNIPLGIFSVLLRFKTWDFGPPDGRNLNESRMGNRAKTDQNQTGDTKN
jgi:hypothetical protein